MSQSLVS